jgi:hypothetical protein
MESESAQQQAQCTPQPTVASTAAPEPIAKRSPAAHLPKWPKGVSGNPGGRKAGLSLTSTLREELEATSFDGKPLSPPGTTVRQKLARQLIRLGMNGDRAALALIFERADGKPPERVDLHVSEARKPITVVRVNVPASRDEPARVIDMPVALPAPTDEP